nr:MAG TPA: hypothetical protein [Caudoviricetes sp.]
MSAFCASFSVTSDVIDASAVLALVISLLRATVVALVAIVLLIAVYKSSLFLSLSAISFNVS